MKAIYPTAIALRNIRADKRMCSACGRELNGYGHYMFLAVARGRYLCRACDEKRIVEASEKTQAAT